MIRVILPIKTVSVMNTREHHFARARRAATHRSTARLCLMAYGKPPAPPLTVKMTRIGFGTLDDDNLASSFKACRDGIADWLGLDDGNPGITWACAQQKGKRGEYGVIVEVT